MACRSPMQRLVRYKWYEAVKRIGVAVNLRSQEACRELDLLNTWAVWANKELRSCGIKAS